MRRTALLTAATLAASPVIADDDSGFLFGIGGGQASYDVEQFDFDDEATAWKAFAGWRINPHFSVELAYIDGGEVEAEIGTVNFSAEAEVIQASIVGGWWFNDTFGAYARAGMNAWDVEAHASGPGASASASDDGNDFGWGAGFQAIWDRGLWRLEYESAEFDGVDTTLISLSLGWRL